jgi:hypothetical protein
MYLIEIVVSKYEIKFIKINIHFIIQDSIFLSNFVIDVIDVMKLFPFLFLD